MKKIIFTMALMCMCLSVFSTRYLVQSGTDGAATWRTAGDGEVLISLAIAGEADAPIALNAWITNTVSGVLSGDEVWIIQGTYLLGAASFFNAPGVKYYGGFVGTETTVSDRATSDLDNNGMVEPWEFTNQTIIDGNAAYRCMNLRGDAATLADGFVIQNGKNANGGAGVHMQNSVTLQNSIIRNNENENTTTGNIAAAGIQNTLGVVRNCLIEGNVNDAKGYGGYGGGIGCTNAAASVEGCVIRNNSIVSTGSVGNNKGGGIFLQSGGKAYNCVVYNNSTVGNGGGIYLEKKVDSPAAIYNCTVVRNQAANQAGGVHSNASGTVSNCIIWGNSSNQTANMNAFFYKAAADDATKTNVDYIAINGGVNYSADIVQATNVVTLADDADIFVAPTATAGLGSVGTANWMLKHTASVLNAGVTQAAVSTDLLGVVRPQGSAYDLGAYELPYYTLTVSAGENGTVKIGETAADASYSMPKGDTKTFTIMANTGYKIATVTYAGENVLPLTEGQYTATVTADATLAVTFALDESTALQNTEVAAQIFAQNGQIVLRNMVQGSTVKVYNLTGKMIFQSMTNGNEMTVPFAQGVYMVQVNGNAQKVIVK